MGKPSLTGRRPQGDVVLFCPTSVVRAFPARHAIDGVVHEEHGNLFAAIGGVHDFRRADGRQVAASP